MAVDRRPSQILYQSEPETVLSPWSRGSSSTSRSSVGSAAAPPGRVPPVPVVVRSGTTSSILRPTPKELRRFDLAVSAAHQTRYADLEETFCSALAKSLVKKKKKHVRPLDVSLVVLGTDAESAQPCILVTCNKSIFKHVTTFFSQPWVKEELRPDAADSFPTFELHVMSIACSPLAGQGAAVFSCRDSHWASVHGGTPIFIQHNNKSSFATLGGLVEVVGRQGQNQVYGLTAGHFVTPWADEDSSDDQDDSTADDDDSDSGEEGNEYFRVDTGDKTSTENIKVAHVADRAIQASFNTGQSWPLLGHVLVWRDKPPASEALDYALICVGDFEFPANKSWHLSLHKTGIHASRTGVSSAGGSNSAAVGFGEEAVFIRRHSDIIRGTLSLHQSSLMLSPSRGFVKTYKLRLEAGQEFKSGDSGGWVIGRQSRTVFGHIVALDPFGHAHVMPLEPIFESIRLHFDAAEVRIYNKEADDRPKAPTGRRADSPKRALSGRKADRKSLLPYETTVRKPLSAFPDSSKRRSPSMFNHAPPVSAYSGGERPGAGSMPDPSLGGMGRGFPDL